jgi:arylsulfatase A-like enzyme
VGALGVWTLCWGALLQRRYNRPMRPARRTAWLVAAVLAAACRRAPFPGPLSLVTLRADGAPARVGTVSLGGETRAALVGPAIFEVDLPDRPLLTFGMGVSWAGDGEAPGWYQLAVKANGRTLLERTLNPRALREWRDVSLPLPGLGRHARLEFDLRVTDRDRRAIAPPAGLVFGVGDPVLHDLDAYGRARGVLLVSIDTVRRDHVGAYGYAKPTTPRFDALAGQGVLFEDAVSSSSWTLPAHLSMLTGVDPGRHGGVDMRHGFNRSVPTVPALLRKAGFATRAVTSHLYVSGVYGVDEGFEHLDFHQDRKATDVAERGIDLLDRIGDRPFFLFLHLYDPHWHYEPPEWAYRIFEQSYAGQMTGLWQDFSKRDAAHVAPADLAHLLALYDGEIRYADTEVGRVLDHLAGRGLDRSTLVIMTSDHGEEFLDHGSWEHQKTLYEEVVRVPLALRAPGIPPRRERAQASLIDLAPTILDWAHVAVPADMQGRDLVSPPADREAYGETDHTIDGTHKLFLRGGAGRWKAILSLSPDTSETRKEEWYDLASDPTERRSVVPAPAVADPIRRRGLERWRAGRGGVAGRPVCLSPEQQERLRALGYVSGAPETGCPQGR